MDNNKIVIMDPNYRDPVARTKFTSELRASSAAKLEHAKIREEYWLNNPIWFDTFLRILCKAKQR